MWGYLAGQGQEMANGCIANMIYRASAWNCLSYDCAYIPWSPDTYMKCVQQMPGRAPDPD